MAAYDDRSSGAYGYETGPHGPSLQDVGTQGRAPVSRLVHLAGALTSVAMICGLVYWGYQLAMRDLNGVPVIRAIDGPARIAPKDPGGELARHTGLSVNDVAGTGSAAPAPDRVTLAPPAEGLSKEDLPMGEMVRQAAKDPQASPPANALGVNTAETALVDAAVDLPQSGETPLAATPDIPVEPGAASPATPEVRPDELAADTPAPDADVIPASVPGVAVSPRPQERPERGDALLAAALERAVTRQMSSQSREAPVVDVAPDAIASGTRMAQLGAFDTPEDAKTAWDQAESRFGGLMEGKKRVIQKATSGGRNFYRLRVVGFADVTEARQFCVALQAEQQNCIPTVAR